VSRTGAVINIEDAYQHPDFNPKVDLLTGYRTAQGGGSGE